MKDRMAIGKNLSSYFLIIIIIELESGGITPPLNDSQETAALPMPELSNLPEILNILSNAKTLQDKDRLASFIVPEVSCFFYIL